MHTIPESLHSIYPFKKNYLDIDNNKLHYLDEGEGEVVLMMHGNPTWSFYYRNLVLDLRNGYRCIAPDHMGCGLSSKPQDYPYRLTTHIHNMRKLVEDLNLKQFHLVIHDWGAAIGMGLAELMPERVGKIIVLNSAAFLSHRIPFRINICRAPFLGPVFIRLLNFFSRCALTMASGRKGGLTGNIKEGYLFPYNNWHNRIAQLRFVQDIPMHPHHFSYAQMQKIQDGLVKFKDHPISIFWGERDFCFNHHFLKMWLYYFPRAEVHRFSEAGHYVLEDSTDDILPLIRKFLQRMEG